MPLFSAFSHCQIKFRLNFAPETPFILVFMVNFRLNMFEKVTCSNNVLCCYVLVLKTFNNSYFWALIRQKKQPGMGHTQNDNQYFFVKWYKGIISFQILFILSKYHKFWLSYEWFSCLNDQFLPRKGLFQPKHLCSPPCLVSMKTFFMWAYWKVFCCFWPIKLRNLSYMILVAPIFPVIFFYHSFYGITLKSKSSIICNRSAEVIFFIWKLNILSFIFLT